MREREREGERERTCRQVDVAIAVDHKLQIKESKKINISLDLSRELKKWGTCGWWWIGTAGDWRKNWLHPIYSITKISLNTEKSPGDLALTQTLCWYVNFKKSEILWKEGVREFASIADCVGASNRVLH